MSGPKDTRTWTDDQLRLAIASEQTWKGVARALGLAQSATPRIRRHARRLGLDASHFTGKRRWSDIDLRLVIRDSSTWAEVLQRLDISDTSETRLRIKGYAVRLGIDVARLNGEPSVHRSAPDIADMPPDLSHLRVAAESIAVAWFSMRGIPVALPSEPCAYDLLVTFTSGIQRVQVKSGIGRTRTGTWQVRLGHRPYSLDKTASIAPYDPDDLDYFWVIVGDGAIYLIPSRAVAGRTSISVRRYAGYRVGDAVGLLTGGN